VPLGLANYARYAGQFADALFTVLGGPLSDLRSVAQEETWVIVEDVITSTSNEEVDTEYLEFQQAVAERYWHPNLTVPTTKDCQK
jgi:hypothetical protein